jgi:NADH:ubiquinone oxidoreductase subunit E
LKPQAPHRIQICYGTACYIKGAPLVLKNLEASLEGRACNCGEGAEFDIETVNCPGNCAQSPLVLIDGNEIGKVKPELAGGILANYQKK